MALEVVNKRLRGPDATSDLPRGTLPIRGPAFPSATLISSRAGWPMTRAWASDGFRP